MDQQDFQPGLSADAAPTDLPGETGAIRVGKQAAPGINGTIERARSTTRKIAEQARAAAGNAGGAAQDLARRAREQAGLAADRVYGQGARAGDYLVRNVNEYPLPALLACGAVGAMIGYGTAVLIHGRA